LPWW